MSLRIRRGTDNERSGITFDLGEIVWTTNSQQLWVGDGVTQGGINILANSAGTGLLWNATTKKLEFAGASYTTDDIAEGTTIGRQYFTAERAQDAVAAALIAGVHTNISFVYNTTQDNANRIDATVTLDGIGITSVSADTSPSLGGNLSLNSHNITGTGAINIIGGVTATTFTGNIVSSQITSINPIDIGLTGAPTYLHVHSNTEQLSVFNGITDNVTPPNIFIETARGSLTSPQSLVAGDQAGGIMFKSFDGLSFKSTANMLNIIADDAVMSDANPKSDMALYTAAGGSSFQEYLFKGDGTFASLTIAVGDGSASNPSIAFSTDASVDTGFFHPADGVVCVSTNGVEKARFDSGGLRVSGFMKVADVAGTLPNPPEAGMIVLDGSTFKGYNGSSWVNLN